MSPANNVATPIFDWSAIYAFTVIHEKVRYQSSSRRESIRG